MHIIPDIVRFFYFVAILQSKSQKNWIFKMISTKFVSLWKLFLFLKNEERRKKIVVISRHFVFLIFCGNS